MGYEETVKGILKNEIEKIKKEYKTHEKRGLIKNGKAAEWKPDLRVCEDQLTFLEQGEELNRTIEMPKQAKKIPAFILILESPHKREFKTNSGIPQPVSGAAGINIKTHFMNSMAIKMAGKTRCYIYLINAIQYQCSLGLTLSTTKDGKMQPNATNQKTKKDVFNAIWNVGGEVKFQKRLQKVLDIFHESFDSPLCVINACTSPFKDITQKTIIKTAQKTNFTIEFFKIPHPSSCSFTQEKAQKI